MRTEEAKLSSQKNTVSFFIYLKLASECVNPTLAVSLVQQSLTKDISPSQYFTLKPDLPQQCSNPSSFSRTHTPQTCLLFYTCCYTLTAVSSLF